MRYRLVDVGFPYKHIMAGRKQIGRVYKHADTKLYHGIIGNLTSPGFKTETAAFQDVVAKHMGCPNVDEMLARMKEARRRKLIHNRRVRAIVDRVLNEGPSAVPRVLDELLKIKK